MPDRKVLLEPNETPEDVATLYSWANLHGAKYRDFSASRAQTREKARLRVQDAIESERRRAREEAEAQKNAEAQKAAETAIMAEAARKQELAIQENARRAEQLAAQEATQQRMWQSPRPIANPAPAPPYSTPQNQAPRPQAAEYEPVPLQAQAPAPSQPVYATAPFAPPPLAANQFAYSPAPYVPASQGLYAVPASVVPQPQPVNPLAYAQSGTQLASATAREAAAPVHDDHYLQFRNSWAPAEPRESAGRPAWLASSDHADTVAPAVPQAPEDTLQASRDRLTSRWFALKGIFADPNTPAEPVPAPIAQRAPLLAVFSLAGGVGKTSLVATLGRALSARGERVLLVDTAAFGLLPFFFGARDQRPGVLRTFTAPGGSGDAPIQMITVDPETLGPETAPQESLTQEIARHGRGMGRVIVDLATASGATTRRVLRMAPTVLVPVVPDMSSVVSVGSIDAFFQHNVSSSGQQVRPFYVLNQFDPSLPLHLDVREVLREQLGDRLLPFALRRTPAISEALAEGMTVVDYAPNSTVAEDFGALAGWVKSLAAPAPSGYRGVRWSER
ncbi:MAG TPA: cellulose synthase operon protein YhjQ/BcsQ [Terracidiphilus sp.]|jgi:cellulose synthase operon protein YhjQ